MYLTTHRIVFTATPITQNANVKSFCAPFYAMYDLNLEQPVFGANYIKGKVRNETGEAPFAFKLKFNKGGAIEFGQAMANAAKMADRAARETQYQPPPAYTPSPQESYYQTSTAYQPQYPVGFALPTQIFNEAPPAGFVYATDAPPPYPGITTVASQQQQQQYGQQQQQYGQQQPQYGQQPSYGQQPAYGQPAYPAYQNGQSAPVYSNGAAPAYGGASAPVYGAPQAGFPASGYPEGAFSQPPTYTDATKKGQ